MTSTPNENLEIIESPVTTRKQVNQVNIPSPNINSSIVDTPIAKIVKKNF